MTAIIFDMSLLLLSKKDPEVMKALHRYRKEIFKKGELTVREKELIAAAISATLMCEKCLEYHADAALEAGATKKELMEAFEVAMYLVGPSSVIWSDLIDHYIEDEE